MDPLSLSMSVGGGIIGGFVEGIIGGIIGGRSGARRAHKALRQYAEEQVRGKSEQVDALRKAVNHMAREEITRDRKEIGASVEQIEDMLHALEQADNKVMESLRVLAGK